MLDFKERGILRHWWGRNLEVSTVQGGPVEGEVCFFKAGVFSTGESVFLFRLRDWLVGVTFLTGSREEGLVVAADGN